MRIPGLLVWGLVTTLVAGSLDTASAQFIGEANDGEPHLTNGDIAQMREIAPQLYKKDGAVKGASETWTNETTHNHGTMLILDTFAHVGQPCRTVRYDTSFYHADATTYVLTWCRTKAGDWKIS
jgi:surface antigen